MPQLHTCLANTCLIALTLAAPAVAQISTFVPPAYAVQDAPSHLWVPGATGGIRMQTLLGPSQIPAQSQTLLTGIALRRSTRDEDFAGTTVQMTVRLSSAATSVDTASPSFAANHGPDLTTTFSGLVTIPASPRTTSAQIAWDPLNSISIPFRAPFPYTPNTTLCLDIEGLPTISPVTVWAADAVIESATGLSTSVGQACGPYAQADGRSAFAQESTLVAGGRARFHAFGTPMSPCLIALSGAAQANALDLSSVGFPGCQLDPRHATGRAVARRRRGLDEQRRRLDDLGATAFAGHGGGHRVPRRHADADPGHGLAAKSTRAASRLALEARPSPVHRRHPGGTPFARIARASS